MSDTLNALLVLYFFLVPGLAGNAIYTKVTGTSWREEPWRLGGNEEGARNDLQKILHKWSEEGLISLEADVR